MYRENFTRREPSQSVIVGWWSKLTSLFATLSERKAARTPRWNMQKKLDKPIINLAEKESDREEWNLMTYLILTKFLRGMTEIRKTERIIVHKSPRANLLKADFYGVDDRDDRHEKSKNTQLCISVLIKNFWRNLTTVSRTINCLMNTQETTLITYWKSQ